MKEAVKDQSSLPSVQLVNNLPKNELVFILHQVKHLWTSRGNVHAYRLEDCSILLWSSLDWSLISVMYFYGEFWDQSCIIYLTEKWAFQTNCSHQGCCYLLMQGAINLIIIAERLTTLRKTAWVIDFILKEFTIFHNLFTQHE